MIEITENSLGLDVVVETLFVDSQRISSPVIALSVKHALLAMGDKVILDEWHLTGSSY